MVKKLILVLALFALFAACFAQSRIKKLKLPDWSKETLEWFDIDPNAKLPVEPERVSKLTKERFLYHYSAKGIPFIVTDMTKDWGAKEWNCNSLRERFPEEEVNAWSNYDYEGREVKKQKVYFKMKDSFLDNIMTIEDYTNITTDEAARKKIDENQKLPSIVSFLWHPINMVRNAGTKRTEVQQKLVDDLGIPYFAEDNKINNDEMFGRLEIFFGLKGSGVSPHADEICNWILSTQCGGKKRWTMTPLPNVKAIEKLNPKYKYRDYDSDMLMQRVAKEKPVWKTTLKAGETLVFPPGIVHSTLVPEDGECSLSFSSQIRYPAPIQYIKHFKTALDDTESQRMCFRDEWNQVIFGVHYPDSDGTKKGNNAFANAFFEEVDTNEDGEIDMEEMENFVADYEDESYAKPIATQFVLFNDEDGDKKVSKEEYRKSLKLWNKRSNKIMKKIVEKDEVEDLKYVVVTANHHEDL